MKLHRFIGDFDLSKKDVLLGDPGVIKQIRNVLRLKTGDRVILSDGKGNDMETVINTISEDMITGTIEKKYEVVEPDRKVTLYLAILKKENFEVAVQKAVEDGVYSIVPFVTERTIKTGINIERLQKIMKEASEQSGRSFVPHLHESRSFEKAIERGANADEKILFHPSSYQYAPVKDAKTVSIFIGPEGGFSEREVGIAREKGYSIASLGSLILRGETAAIVATYRAVHGV